MVPLGEPETHALNGKIGVINDTHMLIIVNRIENDKHNFSWDVYGQFLDESYLF